MNHQKEGRKLEVIVAGKMIAQLKIVEVNGSIEVIDGDNLMPNGTYPMDYDKFANRAKREALKLYGKQIQNT